MASRAERLRLSLKPGTKLARLADGIDFLGYVVRPSHTLVRRRVVAHATAALAAWEAEHVTRGRVHASRRHHRQIAAVLVSYGGHFQHANSYRLQQRLLRRFPWLAELATGATSA